MSDNKVKNESYKNIARKIAAMEVKYRPELKDKYVRIDDTDIKYEENRYTDIYSDLWDHNFNIDHPDTHDDYLDATDRIIDIEVKEIPELLDEDIIIDGKPYDYIEGRSIEILKDVLNHSLTIAHGETYSKYADTCAQLMDPGGRIKKDPKTGKYKGSKDIDPDTGKFKTDLIPHCTAKMNKNEKDFKKVSMLTDDDYERGSATIQKLKDDYLRYDAIDRIAAKVDNFKHSTIAKAYPFMTEEGLKKVKYDAMTYNQQREFDRIKRDKEEKIKKIEDAFKRSGKYKGSEIKKMIKTIKNQPMEENIPDGPKMKKIYETINKKGMGKRKEVRDKYKQILLEEKKKSDLQTSLKMNKDLFNIKREEKRKEFNMEIDNKQKELVRLKNKKVELRDRLDDRQLLIKQQMAGASYKEKRKLKAQSKFIEDTMNLKEKEIENKIKDQESSIQSSKLKMNEEEKMLSTSEREVESKLKIEEKIHAASDVVKTASSVETVAKVGAVNKSRTLIILIIIIIIVVIITVGLVFLLIGGLWGMALIMKNNPKIKGLSRLYLMMYGFTLGWVYVIYSVFKYGWRSIV
jgi:hypothetical protein